jgi:hypothetical protein
VDSRKILRRSCRGDSDGGAGGGRSVMATSGIVSISVVFPGLRRSAGRGKCRGYELEADFFSFPRINAAGGRRGAAQMSRLQAALYFFCCPLAAPRVASVRASPRRVRKTQSRSRSALDLSARSSPELTLSGSTADIIIRQVVRSATSPSNSWKRANW